MANVTVTINYFKGNVSDVEDTNHYLGSATLTVASGTTLQTTTPGTTATYINLNLKKTASVGNGVLVQTDLVATESNSTFSVIYTATYPVVPPTAPVDPFALSPTDQATFYDWLTAKYDTLAITGQPVNNVKLYFPPKCLSPSDAGYSADYANFITQMNYNYVNGTVGYNI